MSTKPTLSYSASAFCHMCMCASACLSVCEFMHLRMCVNADLLESLTSNRPGIRWGSRLQRNTACGLNLLLLYARVQLFRKGPSVCSVIFSQKILEPFNNHQPYVAQTYHDEKRCLGLAGTAVSAGHGKLEGEREWDKRPPVYLPDFSLVSVFAVRELAPSFWWLRTDVLIPPLFSVQMWMKTSGDRDKGD